MTLYIINAILITALMFSISTEARRAKNVNKYGLCSADEYRCKNERCIKRRWFCDGSDDCEDNSDEYYCTNYVNRIHHYECPSHYSFYMCSNFRCIPSIWQCDGFDDCNDNSDEMDCLSKVSRIAGVLNGRKRAVEWIINKRQTIPNKRWGVYVPRIAIALHLTNLTIFNGLNSTGIEIAYEVENHILVNVLRDQANNIPTSELALYIHALLVICVDPEDFHGINLVSKLRQQVENQLNYTSPLGLLALCNAKDKMTAKDIEKLVNVFNVQERPFWTDTQALSLIALSCIAEQPQSPPISSIIHDMSLKLKKMQTRNGSFENIQISALIMQALFASGKEDDDDWDMSQATKFLVQSQHKDGSYGTFLNTYYVLPILYYKSLLNISSSHCKSGPSVDGTKILFRKSLIIEEKISVKYSLWLGDHRDVTQSLIVRVAKHSTFFDVMKLADSLDSKYSFNYNLVDHKPYIDYLSGFQNDPESQRFWFLHKVNETGFPDEALNSSPRDIIPKDGEEYVMWYRREQWIQDHKMAIENKITLPELKQD